MQALARNQSHRSAGENLCCLDVHNGDGCSVQRLDDSSEEYLPVSDGEEPCRVDEFRLFCRFDLRDRHIFDTTEDNVLERRILDERLQFHETKLREEETFQGE